MTWKSASAYIGTGVGCFIAGALVMLNPPPFFPKPSPVVQIKEVKTQSFDKATVACTASFAEIQNIRKEIAEMCKAKPAKAGVK